MISKFIVTGAAGHLARAIITELKRHGYTVRGLILPGQQRDVAGVEYIEGDVTRQETLDALFGDVSGLETAVIHTAGIISIDDKPSAYMTEVNVLGTENIIKLCREREIARLVYVSTVHALPVLPKGQVMREADSFNPELVRGAYAKTKARATQMVLNAARDGLNATVVHPSAIIGPYDCGGNHLTQMIIMYIEKKLPAGVRGGYDFVDVRDVAAGCISAVFKGRRGECYILSNRYCELGDLFEMIRSHVGGYKRPCLPMFIARAALPFIAIWAKAANRRPLFTKYAMYVLGGNSQFSHEKASEELGYATRPISGTIADTVSWLRQYDEKPFRPRAASFARGCVSNPRRLFRD